MTNRFFLKFESLNKFFDPITGFLEKINFFKKVGAFEVFETENRIVHAIIEHAFLTVIVFIHF